MDNSNHYNDYPLLLSSSPLNENITTPTTATTTFSSNKRKFSNENDYNALGLDYSNKENEYDFNIFSNPFFYPNTATAINDLPSPSIPFHQPNQNNQWYPTTTPRAYNNSWYLLNDEIDRRSSTDSTTISSSRSSFSEDNSISPIKVQPSKLDILVNEDQVDEKINNNVNDPFIKAIQQSPMNIPSCQSLKTKVLSNSNKKINSRNSNNNSDDSSNIVPRKRGKLPKHVTETLRKWLMEHAGHPYPSDEEKRMLCSITGLTITQTSNWFINARRRILVPPPRRASVNNNNHENNNHQSSTTSTNNVSDYQSMYNQTYQKLTQA